jgi:predicted DNA-binding transcriptional regulator AlpA
MQHSVNPSRSSNFSIVAQSLTALHRRPEFVGTGEIAEIFGLSRSHIVGRITKRPDFPRPVINISQRVRKWLRSDVEAWALGSGKQ